MDKEIIEAIKKRFPEHWANETDEYIMDYCGFIPIIQELIGNKGATIEEALDEAIRTF